MRVRRAFFGHQSIRSCLDLFADSTFLKPVSAQHHIDASPMDSLWRKPGQGGSSFLSPKHHPHPDFPSGQENASQLTKDKDANSALIRNVRILTHPSLSLQEDFCLDIPPSPTLSQQTITIHLPPSHHLLTVRPTLAAGTAQRQVKIVAMIGMQRLHPSGDASTLAYDIELHPGTTKVDFEAISGPARGAPKSGPPGSEVDYERVTIFFSLLR